MEGGDGMKLVSAIITTHNRLELLKRAIESVRTQTYSNMECIVVDDASTDGTYEYCQGQPVRYLYIPPEESKGGNYARNRGIEMAQGEYVAFLDDDDCWLPEKTTKQVRLLEEKRCGLVYCDLTVENVSDKDWNQVFGTQKFYTYTDGNYLGKYSLLQYNTQIRAYDDANDPVNIPGFFFAYAYDKKIDTVNTSYVAYDENIGAALEYLVEGSTVVIPPTEQLTMLQKILVDLDGDQVDEVVYAINSLGSEYNHQKFSFLCYEDDGEVYRLVSSIGSRKDSNIMHYYSIAQIMDLDGDNKKELIVRDIQYGTAAVERYKIYKQKNDDYQLITSES